MLSLAELGENTGLLALSLKTTKCAVESFIFFYSNLCHFYFPSLRFAKRLICISTRIVYYKITYLSIGKNVFWKLFYLIVFSAAFKVFISSVVIVIGPTPPGPGVISDAIGATLSKSTSPASDPSSRRLIPTSITTAPVLT